MSRGLPALLGRMPTGRERLVAIGFASALLVVVGVVDEATDFHLMLDAFYLLPLLVATWFLGLRGGMVFAVLTTTTWAVIRTFGRGSPELGIGLGVWNGLMRLSVMATVTYLLSRARHEGFTLRHALDHTHALPDVIPICAWCRKLKDERDHWQTLEQFLTKETDVLLTHGVCADCAARLREETQAELETRSTRSKAT